MNLICKPGQMAWIDIPPEYRGTGLEQIHGHVVRVLRLDRGHLVPCWRISPRQCTRFTISVRDTTGTWIRAGELAWTHVMPDAYLRPFKDFPPEELEDLQQDLQRELVP